MFKGEGKLVLENRAKPVLKKDADALIKVTGLGICGTDLPILRVPPVHSAKNSKISTVYLLVDLHESLLSGEWPSSNRRATFLRLTS